MTDEGIHGVGEGTLNFFAKIVETAIHELKPLILGMDPFRVETITQKLIRDVYTDGAQIHMCAAAAIKIACWDIVGKACNQPGYNLWGGRWSRNPRHYQVVNTGALVWRLRGFSNFSLRDQRESTMSLCSGAVGGGEPRRSEARRRSLER